MSKDIIHEMACRLGLDSGEENLEATREFIDFLNQPANRKRLNLKSDEYVSDVRVDEDGLTIRCQKAH
jgi:hypothetical protein